jgi:hypothetical protein
MKKRRNLNSRKPPSRKGEPTTDLAPLTQFDPGKVVAKQGRDEFTEFILALAVAFNDLKGLLLWRQLLQPLRPSDPTKVSAKSGEWHGAEIQIHRLLVAQLHELLKLIKEFESVAGGETMHRLLKKAPPSTRHHWDDLVKIATEKGTPRDTAFAEVLVQTRNSVSYHYYQPKMLIAGFRHYFFELTQGAHNESAFASIGENMEQTRFYFADAAVQGALTKLTEKNMTSAKFVKRLGAVISSVNHALQHIVTIYLEQAKRS